MTPLRFIGKLFAITALTLGFAVSVRAITLADLAKRGPLVIRTVKPGEEVNLGRENQVNNLKEGAKVLVLSSRRLTSLAGISTLTVTDDGKQVPITEVQGLQLFLNDNDLEVVPEEFAALGNVTFIYLNTNRIKAIPEAVTKMKSLQGMYFTENALTEVPAFVTTMKQLRKFQISRNRVKELPANFGDLVNLIHLNLAENELASIPESMAQLTQLRVCDLSGNRLTKLPEAFGKVQILYQLRVRDNPLTALPAGFEAMPGTIDITGTKIKAETLSPKIRAKIGTEKPAVKPTVIVKPAK